MQTPQETIKELMLRDLAGANSIRSACLIGRCGGYALAVRYGDVERTLASTRGDIRLFKLENASKFLCEIGIAKFEVDATSFVPGRIRKARPDRAEALKHTKTKPVQGSLI